jgi:hypothetical protein
VTDGLRARLEAAAPPTSGRLSESGFLLSGAAAGLLGWTGTQVFAWVDPPSAALLATGLWAALMLGFVGLTVFHAPAAIRFSLPMLGWGTVNGMATVLTVAGLAGLVPGRVAFWAAWVVAAAVGYCWTGSLLVRAGDTERGRSYLASGLVALAVLAVGLWSFAAVAPVAFLVLTVLHALPLTLDARTMLSPVARGGILSLVVAVLLAGGTAL